MTKQTMKWPKFCFAEGSNPRSDRFVEGVRKEQEVLAIKETLMARAEDGG